MRARLTTAGVLLGCLTLSACGSTAMTTSSATVAGDGLGGAAESGGVGSDGLTGPADGPGAVAQGDLTAGAQGTTPGTGPAAASAQSPGQGPAQAAGGTGSVTASGARAPVQVGFVLFPDAAQAAQSVYGSSSGNYDQRAVVDRTVKAVNAAGGLAGHQIVPVVIEVEIANSKPYSQMYQEICESFTKDHKVIATVLVANAHNDLPICLGNGGSAYFASGHFIHDAQDYRQVPTMVTSSEAAAQRVVPELVSLMAARDALKRGDKVGILHMDYGAVRRTTTNVLKPLVEKHGGSLLTYEVPYPQSTADIANSAAVVQSAVLRFAAEGVKTVMFLCPGCFTFFVQYAQNQNYYPRYALTSYDTLNTDRKAYARSLQSAFAMGWEPLRDVGAYADPTMQSGNPSYRACRELHKDQIVNEGAAFGALSLCGLVRDVQAAAAKVPPGEPLTFRSLIAGAERLGTSHSFPGNLATTLRPDRHDGSSAYRTLTFDASRGVFRYESKTRHPLR